jgi:hypothetical protein
VLSLELITGGNAVVKFCNMVERKAHGTHWTEKRGAHTIKLIAFGEHIGTNPHWHAPAEIPERTLKVLARDGGDLWFKLQPRGQLGLECPPKNVQAIIDYATKRLLEADAADRVRIY